MTKNIVLTMLAAAGLTCSGSASEISKFISQPVVTAAYSSQDSWRGVNHGDNDLGVDIGADLHLLGFKADTSVGWSNNDAQNEFELSIGTDYVYTLPVLDEVTFRAEFNYYSDGTDVLGDVESELGLGISKSFGFADVSLTQFVALQGYNDGYGELSFNFSEVYPDVFLTTTVGYLLEEFEVTHLEVSAVLPGTSLPALDVDVKPFVKGVYTFNGRDGIWSGQDGLEVIGGLSLTRTF